MRSLSGLAALVLSVSLTACGGGGGSSSSSSSVTGTAHLLNGSTAVSSTGAVRAAARIGALPAMSTQYWKFTPKQMTVTVTGVGFGNTQRESEKNKASVSGCSATFDLTKAALASLADCTISAPAGTWSTMTLYFSNDYTMLVDDDAGSVYSDSSSSNGLVTTVPTGGATTIAVHDTNSVSQAENQLTLTLPSAVTIDESNPPQVYVVFNPIHWMGYSITDGTIGAPTMQGNPPVIASTSSFGKAQYYTTVGTLGAYQQNGGCGFILLYSDANTPVLATQVDGGNVASSSLLGLSWQDPAVSFDGDTTDWGRFGYLGLDAAGMLAWAPAYYDTSVGSEILGYRGLVEMKAIDVVGATTTLNWKSTSGPPAPSSGVNYSSGAPDWNSVSTTGCTAGTCSGSYTMTLLVD